MSDYPVRLLKFKDDGVIPNNSLPVIVYTQIAETLNKSEWFEQRFILNGWTNNWRDIVLSYDHFHSNTHEVLGIGKGQVTLQIGGTNGIQLTVRAGDALIIPAGVGHIQYLKVRSTKLLEAIPTEPLGTCVLVLKIIEMKFYTGSGIFRCPLQIQSLVKMVSY